MDKRTGNILKYTLAALTATFLLWFSFRGVQWGDFTEGLKKCNWFFVAASLLIGAVAFWVRAVRWRELLLPIDPSVRRLTALNAINISYVVNMVIPRGGELARCAIVTRHSAKDKDGKRLASFDKVLGTVILDRVWDTIVMLFILAAVLFAFRQIWGDFFQERVKNVNFSSTYAILGVLVFIVLLLTCCYFLKDKNRFFGKIWGFVYGIIDGARQSLKMKKWWKFLGCTLLLWTCYWATSYAIVFALSDAFPAFGALGPLDVVFLMAVGSIASVIPVPGGFGAYHYLISTALVAVYGMAPEQGILFAVLSHESQTVIQLICGAASYACETFIKS